ncbi:MAG TPA: M1 family metallopeptidase [Vicinamibacterales bacterium]|nr:M1 family metallopeptidase [Vicinamibacterales bacterium]
MRWRVALIVLLLGSAALPGSAERLPKGVSPTHYDLWFEPDLARATFRGRESIRISLDAPRQAITLNAAEITFERVSVEDAVGTQDASVTTDEAAETATLTVPRAVPKGTATIHVTYTGLLNDKLRGFYLSEANGRRYAVSQMEATDARRAFPSFDEPAQKATFAVTLMVDAGDTAISNGRQVSDTPGPEPGKHTVAFATTPKMSTYLVALIVGDFVCRTGAAGSTPIRVCATPDKVGLTGFALTAAEQQVTFFGQYFGIPYPYEKLDIIGIPDFAAGAMENAGAITFRERLLLADEKTASMQVKKDVAAVTAHEIAHQWFGDLVTMKWWDDIWLNEGFATWAANKPLAAWKPEWRMELNAAAETQTALGLDALNATRSIRTEVETPAEINEVFDPIAYEKTSGVLNMLEAYVGPEKFREGVSSYLSKYSTGNAAGEDFWTEMTRVTEKPVNRVMKSFVEQPGAPLLAVRTRCVGDATEVTVRQQRYVGTPGAAAIRQQWTLPVCVKTGAGAATCSIVSEAEQTIRAPGCGAAMVNADARGYYITEYEPAALSALATRTPPLTSSERISLLGDEWRLVAAGRHDVGTYLDLAAAFAGDPTPAVLTEAARRLGFVGQGIAGSSERERFSAWVSRTYRPVLERVGIDPSAKDDEDTNSRRGVLWQLLTSDAELQARAKTMARAYMSDPASLPPTLVAPLLQVAAAGGDQALYDAYLQRMKAATKAPEEFYRYFNALGLFRDPALIERTLRYSISGEVRSQDTPLLLAQMLASPAARDASWAFVQREWPALTAKVGVFQGLPAIVGSLGGFCSTERAAEIRTFFASRPVPEAARSLQQALERIETCAALRARQEEPLKEWLEKR